MRRLLDMLTLEAISPVASFEDPFQELCGRAAFASGAWIGSDAVELA